MARGNVEVLSCKEEIQKMIGDGYIYSNIYRVLYDKNKITISYRQFCRYLLTFDISKIRVEQLQESINDARIQFQQTIGSIKKPEKKTNSSGQLSSVRQQQVSKPQVLSVQKSSDKESHFSIPNDEDLI